MSVRARITQRAEPKFPSAARGFADESASGLDQRPAPWLAQVGTAVRPARVPPGRRLLRPPVGADARRAPPPPARASDRPGRRRRPDARPAVAARTHGSPSSAAVAAASVSRSKITSMWSEMKPIGTSTTPGHRRSARAPQVVVDVRLQPGLARRPGPGAVDQVARRAPRAGGRDPAGSPRRRPRRCQSTYAPSALRGSRTGGAGHRDRDRVGDEDQPGAVAPRRPAGPEPATVASTEAATKPGWFGIVPDPVDLHRVSGGRVVEVLPVLPAGGVGRVRAGHDGQHPPVTGRVDRGAPRRPGTAPSCGCPRTAACPGRAPVSSPAARPAACGTGR